MSRNYAQVFPEFWSGDTGRNLRSQPPAQRLALYLITSPHANMIGFYYLPTTYICHDVGMDREELERALSLLDELSFAHYDRDTEYVWVREMARFQVEESLKEADNRIKNIQSLFDGLPDISLKERFFDRYSGDFWITPSKGHPTPSQGASDSLPREMELPPTPLEGSIEQASYPLPSQEQEQEQNQDQEHEDPLSPPAAGINEAGAESQPAGPDSTTDRGSRIRPVRRKRTQGTPTPLPEGFEPSQANIEWFRSKYGDVPKRQVDHQTEQFKQSALRDGKVFIDWQAAWRTWMNNWKTDFGRNPPAVEQDFGSRPPGVPEHDPNLVRDDDSEYEPGAGLV